MTVSISLSPLRYHKFSLIFNIAEKKSRILLVEFHIPNYLQIKEKYIFEIKSSSFTDVGNDMDFYMYIWLF